MTGIDTNLALTMISFSIVSACIGFCWGIWFANRRFNTERALMRECLSDWNKAIARAHDLRRQQYPYLGSRVRNTTQILDAGVHLHH